MPNENEQCGCMGLHTGCDTECCRENEDHVERTYCRYPALKHQHDEAVEKIKNENLLEELLPGGNTESYKEGLRFALECLEEKGSK